MDYTDLRPQEITNEDRKLIAQQVEEGVSTGLIDDGKTRLMWGIEIQKLRY